LSSAVFQDGSFVLKNIQTLKLRQLGLSNSSVNTFLACCPNLTRLDLSFTHVHRPFPGVLAEATIEKLSLTSTAISGVDVVALISSLPHIKSLALGALGGGQGSSVAVGNTSAMTMTDQTLESLTDVLKHFEQLEKISLVGNTKLGVTSRRGGALEYFIQCVGRKCKVGSIAFLSHVIPEFCISTSTCQVCITCSPFILLGFYRKTPKINHPDLNSSFSITPV
jgi:Leucine-rich repeat (LRR) protein